MLQCYNVDLQLAHALPVEHALAEVVKVAGGPRVPPAGLLIILNVETMEAGHSAKVVQQHSQGCLRPGHQVLRFTQVGLNSSKRVSLNHQHHKN